MHTLLQHLPDLPPDRWDDAATRHAAQAGLPGLAAETLAILRHPDLTPIFAPGSRAEVPLNGLVGDRGNATVIDGVVDRLAVTPDAVWLADFKTNRDPPANPAAAPVQYLRQMAAYRAVLTALFPDRPVRCVLVWTQGARVMALPDALLDRYAPGAALSTA